METTNNLEKREQIERGLRIKNIRVNELKMTKTELASKIGITSQFLGLVEDGRSNLVYKHLKKLREISGHSADFILYGLDDTVIDKTCKLLKHYTYAEIINAIEALKTITVFIRNTDEI